jgi:hypothetical protein
MWRHTPSLLILLLFPWNFGTQVKSIYYSLLQLRLPANDLSSPHKPSERTTRKYVTWSLSTVVWRHCLGGSVFTEPLPRNGLHNPAALLLRACNTGCSSSRCLAMRWHITINTMVPPRGTPKLRFYFTYATTFIVPPPLLTVIMAQVGRPTPQCS